MTNRSNLFGAALLLLFTLSGFSGLIYQSVWSHYLGLTLGHAAYAQTLVLAIFMGGMAIGAWLASRQSRRWSSLLTAYALIEALVGIFGLFFHELFVAYTGFSHEAVLPALTNDVFAHAYQWATATLLILPQSVCLGMTFPLMCAAYMRIAPEQDGRILGGLYFTNSLGAAIGALTATFILLPAVGMPGAMRIAGGVNLLVAAGAFWVARAAHDEAAPQHARHDDAPGADTAQRNRLYEILLFSSFVTGATSFVYEIGWVRLLNLALGATLHSFELMLAAFIFGLALGGAWVRRRGERFADSVEVAGIAQILMGIAALLSLVVFAHAFDWTAWLIGALSKSNSAYTLYALGSEGIALLVMLPAAFFAGTTLPLFTLALLRRGHGESSIGRIYATNTLGAIAGVFLTVHVLIPLIGVRLAVILAAVADIGLGLVLIRRYVERLRPALYVGAAATAFVCVLVVLPLSRIDLRVLASGVFRNGVAELDRKSTVPYYRDGKTASISVSQATDSTVAIATNGKTDAAIQINPKALPTLDEVTMIMAAALPLGLHPNPEQIGIIGFGSGLTTHTFLGSPVPKNVDTVEIEPAMYEGARLFGARVARAYKDPRSHIRIDDARTYFSVAARKYDVIVSEPSNPWVSGVSSLFTREFYRFAAQHLKPNGLLVQWLQLYEIDDSLVASIIAALHEQFPYSRAYLSNTADMLLIASDRPIGEFDAAAIAAEPLASELKRVDLGSVAEFNLRQIGGRAMLDAYVALNGAAPHSDYYPEISLKAPRARFRSINAQLLLTIGQTGEIVPDMLGIRTPALAGALINEKNPISSMPTEVATARKIRNSMLSGKLEPALTQANPGFANSVSQLLSLSRQCVDDSQVSEWVAVASDVSRYTIAYFTADELEGVWIHPQWMNCANPKDPIALLLRAFDAAARRDSSAMETASVAALAAVEASQSVNVKQRLLILAMLGAATGDSPARTASIEATHGKGIPAQGQGGAVRSFLLAYADTQSAGKTATNNENARTK